MLVCSCNGIVSAVTGLLLTLVVLSESRRRCAEWSCHRRVQEGHGSVAEKSERRLPLRGGMGWLGKGPWDFLGARPPCVLVESRVILVYVFVTTPPLHI